MPTGVLIAGVLGGLALLIGASILVTWLAKPCPPGKPDPRPHAWDLQGCKR